MTVTINGNGTLSNFSTSSLSTGTMTLSSFGVIQCTDSTTGIAILGGNQVNGANSGGQINLRGASGNQIEFINNNNTMRMLIDPNGRITKPYQPFFLAKNGDQAGDGITTNPFRFSNVVYNIGNHFVTSGTGAFSRFVAPVSGVYAFTTNPGYKQTNLDFICRARINGSNFSDVIRLISYPSSHSSGCYGFNIYLNANDYVDLSTDGCTYHRNNADVANWFSGILLG